MPQTINYTFTQTVREIDEYIVQRGGNYREWYVGIASNPRDRLFSDHNVNVNTDAWIYRDAGSSYLARQVESYFLSAGCQGGGGGDLKTRYVYAYKINRNTIQ